MEFLLSFLSSIPAVVWSGLIASFLTLGGVLISNRSNTNRLLLQLQHDATEKTKERTAALRRGSMPFRVERNDFISSWPERTDGRADG